MKKFVEILAKNAWKLMKDTEDESYNSEEELREDMINELKNDEEGKVFASSLAEWYKEKTGEELVNDL